MSYHPTVEQAARVGTMLARLDDPRELARIAGIGEKQSGLNRADLPSREYIKSRTLYIRPGVGNVDKYLERQNEERRRELGLRYDEQTIQRIAELAASGMVAQDIAREIGATRPAIAALMHRYGISFRRMTPAEIARKGAEAWSAASKRNAKRLSDEQGAEVRRLAELGWMTNAIAEAVGTSKGAVRYYAEVHGLAIRKMTRAEVAKAGAEAARAHKAAA